jgi:hypothetical protein
MLLYISLLFLALLWGAACLIVIWTIKTGIPPMPTSRKAKTLLLNAISPLHSQKIIELGSGWGTLLFPLAEQHPSSLVIGYEISPLPYFFSKLRHYLQPFPNLQIYRKDFFQISLKEASIVVCYLFPRAMENLKIKFESELDHALVISNTFAISGWDPIEILELNDIYHSKIYIYFKIKNLQQ